MKAFMYKTIAAIVIVIAVLAIANSRLQAAQEEVSSLKQQLAHAQMYVPLERDTVVLHTHDTLEVVTAPVITAELKALRRQRIIDDQLIKNLQLRIGQLDAVQNTTVVTEDTARAAYDHSLKVFSYLDNWSFLQFRLQDSTFYYNIRDSLATLVYHEYKHRFLWWRWGVKGYKVKVVNFNPHSTIRYNTYVKPE